MKRIDSNLIIVVLFIGFLVAPISESLRFFMISVIPLILGVKNAIILRDQILYNIENKKFVYIEKKFGTKRAFWIYAIMLVLIPIMFFIMFFISAIKLL